MSDDLLILLTNDDGAEAPGLLQFKKELSGLGRVVVVAPYEERSAVSHALTIHHPIRIIRVGDDHYALTGNPADCVIFALRKLLPRSPDLVVSGINHGANLGDDIVYSGTVAGAREGSIHRLPSVAVSLVTRKPWPDFRGPARYVTELVREFHEKGIPEGTFLNINVPEGSPTEFRFTRQGSKLADSSIEEKLDPRGRKYYWIGQDESEWVVEADTDYQAIRDGVVSVSPLHRDQTDYRTLRAFTERVLAGDRRSVTE